MDNRKRIILRAVVEEFIENAEPVGSKTLTEKIGLNVSSATLRNEMSALEELGYLEHPHTSAGRVPTSAGYRLYVDELMRRRRLSLREMESINQEMRRRLREVDGMVAEAGRLIAQLTNYAAFAAAPVRKSVRVQRIEAFLTDPSALVLVIAADGGTVKTKWVRLPDRADYADIAKLTQALNTVYAGQSEFTEDMARRCAALCAGASRYLPFALELLGELEGGLREVYVSGETQLLEQPEFQDLLRARKTLEFLSERRQTLIPDRDERDENVRVLIGPENVAAELRDASVMMASYRLPDGMRGVIGVVGPTRMDYSRLESRLSYFASKLGELLDKLDDS